MAGDDVSDVGDQGAIVAQRLATIRERIAATGRNADEVRIVAMTKALPFDAVERAVAGGIVDLGENYAADLLDKAARASDAGFDAVRWHFLGAVQRNKVARLALVVAMWQGVDRVAAAAEIARRAPGASVLVQVNLSGAPQRGGCSWDEAPSLVSELVALELDVAGLMGVASIDRAAADEEFARLAALRADLGLRELSIGMTDDFEAAVAAGSTIVRIGRGLFGARPEPLKVRR